MYGERNEDAFHGRILFPICHVYRDNSGRNAALTERNQESLYTGSRFSPPALPAPGKQNGFCRFVKNMITHRKSTDTIHIQHEPAFPDDKSRVDAGFSCDLALPPDSERPAILTGSDTIRVFVVPFDSMKKAAPHGLLFFIVKTPDWSHTYAR